MIISPPRLSTLLRTLKVVLAVFSFNAVSPAEAAQSETGIALQQTSLYYGPMSAKLCHNGVCLEAGRLRMIVPPGGDKILFLNLETKCYAEQKVMAKTPLYTRRKHNPYIFEHDGTMAGLKAKFYKHDSNLTEGVIWHYACADVKQLPIKESMADAMAAFCLLPVGQGLPLMIDRTTPNTDNSSAEKRTLHVLATQKVAKTTFPHTLLEVPGDYKKIGTVAAVMSGRYGAASDNSLLDWMSEPKSVGDKRN